MNELLNNPAFQSGLLPFLVALGVAWGLRGRGWVWSGLGFAVGYFASVYVVMGMPQWPLTSARKIVVLGAAAVLLGLLLDGLAVSRRGAVVVAVVTALGAAAWLVWPVAARREGMEFWTLPGVATLYAAWLSASMAALRGRPPQAALAALMLGLGTGLSAILGASALLGQLGIAVAAAAGAGVLLLLMGRPLDLGYSHALPAALLSALTGIAAIVYASLPWYSLAPLVLAPLLVRIPLAGSSAGWRGIILPGLMALPAAAAAVALAWWQAGPPPF